jgi:hypothetical protein
MNEIILTKDIISLFFPNDIIKYFDITKYNIVKTENNDIEYLDIYFEEKNIIQEPYNKEEYESHGFMQEKRIQDFPIRGKAVYLNIKKRRWRHKKTKLIIQNDFSFICSKGAKLTTELSVFLKDTGR